MPKKGLEIFAAKGKGENLSMIKGLDLQNSQLVKELFELQRASYLIEAKLINFFEIPPLIESIEDLKNSDETFLGYFEGDLLAGAVSFTIDGGSLTICRMIVHPDQFRKGIAQRLLTKVEELNKGISTFKVSTGRENPPAKSLYLKNGYRFKGDIEVVPGLFISHFEKSSSPK